MGLEVGWTAVGQHGVDPKTVEGRGEDERRAQKFIAALSVSARPRKVGGSSRAADGVTAAGERGTARRSAAHSGIPWGILGNTDSR
jgi:hypothetical protein